MSPIEFSRRKFIETLTLGMLSPVAMRLGEALSFFSKEHPLTPDEEKRLYETSLTYLAPTMEEAIMMAKRIDFIPKNNYEWPDNMCGPLAIDQLVKAGLLPAETKSADFWLLNPRVKQSLLEATFPRDKYSWFKTETPLADYDFKTSPLYSGDFVYTLGGSFEHMLTVNRVDEKGRVFAVTNLLTGGKYKGKDEFAIREVMLYDPSVSGTGQFYDWRYGKDRAKLGTTGTAGFAYWRRGSGGDPVEAGARGETVGLLDALLRENRGEWHALIRNITEAGDRDIYTRATEDMIHPASVIKVPIAMLFFSWAEKQKEGLGSVLKKGLAGRSYEQLLRAMLVNSEEAATATLASFIEKNLPGGSKRVLADWKLSEISISPRKATVGAMTNIFEDLFRGKLIGQESREKILGWLAEHTESDETRLGLIKKSLPPGWKVNIYNKRGSIAEGIVVVADAGIIEFTMPDGQKKTYVAEFFGYPGKAATYQSLHDTIGEAAKIFAAAVVSGKV